MAIPTVQAASAFELGLHPRRSGTSTDPDNQVTLPMAIQSLRKVAEEAFQTFVEEVRDIPSVEQVRADATGTYIHIVTYVSESPQDERYRIYGVEREFYERYPSLQLEFDLVDRKGYPLDLEGIANKYVATIRQLPNKED